VCVCAPMRDVRLCAPVCVPVCAYGRVMCACACTQGRGGAREAFLCC